MELSIFLEDSCYFPQPTFAYRSQPLSSLSMSLESEAPPAIPVRIILISAIQHLVDPNRCIAIHKRSEKISASKATL